MLNKQSATSDDLLTCDRNKCLDDFIILSKDSNNLNSLRGDLKIENSVPMFGGGGEGILLRLLDFMSKIVEF